MQDNIKAQPDECFRDNWIRKRVLWHSDRDASTTIDAYADKLELVMDGDERFALKLSVGGEVIIKGIKDITKYV